MSRLGNVLIHRFDTGICSDWNTRVLSRKVYVHLPPPLPMILFIRDYIEIDSGTQKGEGETGEHVYMCVCVCVCVRSVEPNVAAMVAMCILISSVFPHSACTEVH